MMILYALAIGLVQIKSRIYKTLLNNLLGQSFLPNFLKIEKKNERVFLFVFFQFYFCISLRLLAVQYWSSLCLFYCSHVDNIAPSDSTW